MNLLAAASFENLPGQMRRPLMVLAAAIVGLLAIFHSTGAAMVAIWSRSDTFAHGFLVPPIALWLIWRMRDRFQSVQPHIDARWLLPLAAAAFAWLLGSLVTVNALSQFMLVVMVVTLVPLILGWDATRVMLFPLLYLFFCVPVGEFLLPVLMEGTADFTVAALRASGIPVYREGLQFVIPSGNWSVVEGCSGVRYMMASVMVGSLFAYLNFQSLHRRLMFVGVSIVVPIVANWLRAYMIVMLGHLSDNRIATGVDHLVYGWLFFGVVITVMFMIGSRWAEPDRARTPAPHPDAAALAAGATTGRFALIAAAALLVVLMAPLADQWLRARAKGADVQLAWPSEAPAGDWVLVDEALPWQPQFQNASVTRRATFRRNGITVGAYIAYYRDQTHDRKLVTSTNMLVTSLDPMWATYSVDVQRAGDATWRSTDLVDRRNGIGAATRHRTVWQTYWVDDAWSEDDVLAKALGAKGMLAGRGDDGAAVILFVDQAPKDGGNRVLAEFVQAQLPELRAALLKARGTR